MLHFIYRFPDIVIIVGCALALGLLAVLIMVALNRFMPALDKDATKHAQRAMNTARAILVFVLAFSIVQASSDLSRVQETLNTEARTLGVTDRMLLRFDRDATASTREMLARYTYSIIKDEWPEMSKGWRSPETAMLSRRIARYIDDLQPGAGRQQTIYGELVRGAEAIELKRGERLFHADNTRLSNSFWLMIIILVGAIMLLGALIRPSRMSIVMMIGSQGAMIGLLVGFLLVLDEPFLGQSGVSVEPFKRILSQLSAAPTLGSDALRGIGVTPVDIEAISNLRPDAPAPKTP
jgi:hypothetical protein